MQYFYDTDTTIVLNEALENEPFKIMVKELTDDTEYKLTRTMIYALIKDKNDALAEL